MKRSLRLPLLLLAVVLPLTALAQSKQGDGEAEEPTVKGIEQPRSGGGFLGLDIEGTAFVLRFYDDEKKEIAPDAVRALARWNPPRKAGQERTVLVASGGALRSPAVVRPPHAFVVYLTLIGPDENVLESAAFNMRNLP